MHNRSGRVVFSLALLAVSCLVVLLCSHNIMRYAERQSSKEGNRSVVNKSDPEGASLEVAGDKNSNVSSENVHPEGLSQDQGAEHNKDKKTVEDNSPDGVARDDKTDNGVLFHDSYKVVTQEQVTDKLSDIVALNGTSPNGESHDPNAGESNGKVTLEVVNPSVLAYDESPDQIKDKKPEHSFGEKVAHDEGALGTEEGNMLDDASPEIVALNQGADMNNAIVKMEKIGHILKITTLVSTINGDYSLTEKSNTLDEFAGGLQVSGADVSKSFATSRHILPGNEESPVNKTDKKNAKVTMAKMGHSLKITILMDGDTPIPNSTNRVLESVSGTQVRDSTSRKENESGSQHAALDNSSQGAMQGKISSPVKDAVEYTSVDREPEKPFRNIQKTEEKSTKGNVPDSEVEASVNSSHEHKNLSPVKEAIEYTSASTEPQKPFQNVQTTGKKSGTNSRLPYTISQQSHQENQLSPLSFNDNVPAVLMPMNSGNASAKQVNSQQAEQTYPAHTESTSNSDKIDDVDDDKISSPGHESFPDRLKLNAFSRERSDIASSLHSPEQSQNISQGGLTSMQQEDRSVRDEVDEVSKNNTQSVGLLTPIVNALAHPLDFIYNLLSGTFSFIKRIANGLW